MYYSLLVGRGAHARSWASTSCTILGTPSSTRLFLFLFSTFPYDGDYDHGIGPFSEHEMFIVLPNLQQQQQRNQPPPTGPRNEPLSIPISNLSQTQRPTIQKPPPFGSPSSHYVMFYPWTPRRQHRRYSRTGHHYPFPDCRRRGVVLICISTLGLRVPIRVRVAV